MLEAQMMVDERSNKIKETKDNSERYALKSKQMANTAELLKMKFAGQAAKKAAKTTCFF